MKTLTVKELRNILNYIPDDAEVVMVDENIPTNVVRITQVNYLASPNEEHPALGFASLTDASKMTPYHKNYFFDGRDNDETKEIS